jgi:hypothetical protein
VFACAPQATLADQARELHDEHVCAYFTTGVDKRPAPDKSRPACQRPEYVISTPSPSPAYTEHTQTLAQCIAISGRGHSQQRRQSYGDGAGYDFKPYAPLAGNDGVLNVRSTELQFGLGGKHSNEHPGRARRFSSVGSVGGVSSKFDKSGSLDKLGAIPIDEYSPKTRADVPESV